MKREPINFSINLGAHSAGVDEIPIENAAATAYRCLLLMQSLLTVITNADADKLQQMDSNDLSITFGHIGHIGDIGAGLCDEALALIDILEDERQRLAALLVRKGGKQ